jgi:hypothetical protein
VGAPTFGAAVIDEKGETVALIEQHLNVRRAKAFLNRANCKTICHSRKRSLMVSSKVDFVPFRHSVLDTESSEFSHLWIPAFAGMTFFGLLTSSSSLMFIMFLSPITAFGDEYGFSSS